MVYNGNRRNSMRLNIYTGTYFTNQSRGIYCFTMNTETGVCFPKGLIYELPDAKYLAVGNNLIAAAYCKDEGAGVCLLKREAGTLIPVAEEVQGKAAPCFTGFAGERLFTANYHEGTVFVYHRKGEVLELEKRLSFGAGAGCHQVLVSGDQLLVPCLEQDRICLFDLKAGVEPAGELSFPKGSGPRHGVIDRECRRLWVTGERDNRLHCFFREEEQWLAGDSIEFLPSHTPGGSALAAIRISPEGRFLTVSARGANLLTTWEITGKKPSLNQQVFCEGDHPRDFIYTPDGRWLLCANRGSGEVVCFSRDRENGMLTGAVNKIKIEQAVSLAFQEEIV